MQIVPLVSSTSTIDYDPLVRFTRLVLMTVTRDAYEFVYIRTYIQVRIHL